jgi:hypothetical protein
MRSFARTAHPEGFFWCLNSSYTKNTCSVIKELGRKLASHAGGHRFESCRAHQSFQEYMVSAKSSRAEFWHSTTCFFVCFAFDCSRIRQVQEPFWSTERAFEWTGVAHGITDELRNKRAGGPYVGIRGHVPSRR